MPLSSSPPTSSIARRPVQQWRETTAAWRQDALAAEEPLEIRVNGTPLAVTMRTPGHDEDLAAGFCLSESVVPDGEAIERIEACVEAEYGNIVNVRVDPALAGDLEARLAQARRQAPLASACGLCGKQSIDRVRQVLPVYPRVPFTVTRRMLAALPDRLRGVQATFEATGGLHASGFFQPDGALRFLREDVGRHNAVDKVIGAGLTAGHLPLGPGVLLVSGRSSFEIMQKAAMAGVDFVAAVSAPSQLAVDFAQETGMTLVGFLRPGRMNVYTGAHRIAETGSAGLLQP